MQLRPNQSLIQIKIDNCENAIAKIEEDKNNAEYKRLINLADIAYNNKQFDKAKDLYIQALTVLPNESYPSIKFLLLIKKSRSGEMRQILAQLMKNVS